MSLIEESMAASKEWSLRRRVLWHVMLHQLALMEWTLEPNHPMLNQYKTFSYDAIRGFLIGKPFEECLNDVKVADEVFANLYTAIGKTLEKEFREDPLQSESTTSFIVRTHIVMAPLIIREHFESISEKAISQYFDDIEIDEENQMCFSKKLQELSVSLGNQRVDRLTNFMDENPVVSFEYNSLSEEDIPKDEDQTCQAPVSRYNIFDHQESHRKLRNIVRDDGLYAPLGEFVFSSFELTPPSDFKSSDPSSFYVNQLEYMFKKIEKDSKGYTGDLQALEISIRTWIRMSIQSFYKGDYAQALYIISAVVTEFVKGCSIDFIFYELEEDEDFQYHINAYLKDALSLTLLYMEYVDDQVYSKVEQRLQHLVDTQTENNDSPLSIDFTPFVEYQTKRNEMR